MRQIALLALGILASGVAACSGDGGKNPQAAPPDSAGSPPRDGGTRDADDPATPDDTPDGSAPVDVDATFDLSTPGLAVGVTARVTADTLNLRSGPSTSDAVMKVMPCGASVLLVGGPSGVWWSVDYTGTKGWASSKFLVPAAAFDPSVCPAPVDAAGGGGKDAGAGVDGGGKPGTDETGIFARAKLGVGFSYYWGHGSWRSDGAQHGACFGSCPGCTHNGAFGADCSGFVAKCWQVPSPSPVETDLHPYSTSTFYNQTTHWTKVPRSKLQPADALVYNSGGSGHIVLFESGSDPWGSVWVYEARGCSYGIQHDLRAIPTSYIAIRREGL